MKKIIFFYTVALTVGLLTACSSDDEQKLKSPIRHISVEVSQQAMTDDATAAARSLTTRGTIKTTENFDAFSMTGVYNDLTNGYSATKSEQTSTWTLTPDTWIDDVPNNYKVPFYAFNDGTFQWNSGTPYIDFTVNENASSQLDLLVASANVAYKDHQGKVPLTFDHACAAVTFNVFMSNTLSTQLKGTTLTVNSIVLRNVNNRGKYYFGTGWGDVSKTTYYTLTDGNITITTEAQNLSSNYLFMIPQSHVANGTTGVYLDISYTYTGQKKNTATIPLTVNWEKGIRYTINIKLGTNLIK